VTGRIRSIANGVETQELGIGALKHTVKVGGLRIDLIGIEDIVQKSIMIYVSHPIKSSQKEPLTHSARS
jgi:hypothetical protein